MTPLADASDYPGLPMTFEIAMGVRRDDLALRRELQSVVERRGSDITAILKRSGVPLLPFSQPRMEVIGDSGTKPSMSEGRNQ